MMVIYHGSLEIVDSPKILKANRPLDFGSGFYTTSSKRQAKNWVKRKDNESDIGYINVYEFDIDKAKDLNVLKFKEADESWVDFVYENRMGRRGNHSYDIVMGPVADDSVFTAFSLYEMGYLDKQGLIKELMTYKLVDQILFHSEAALSLIKFSKAIKIQLCEKPSTKNRYTSSSRLR